MAVIAFDVTAFRAGYPAFQNATTYPDADLNAWFNSASAYVSNDSANWNPASTGALALNLMTAHLLALLSVIASGAVPGRITQATIDKVSTSFQAPPNESGWQNFLFLTPYGVQLQALLGRLGVGGRYYPGNGGFH